MSDTLKKICKEYIPYVIEPSLGVERLFLTVLCNGYEKEELENGVSFMGYPQI